LSIPIKPGHPVRDDQAGITDCYFILLVVISLIIYDL
jgi:hypothetical protein